MKFLTDLLPPPFCCVDRAGPPDCSSSSEGYPSSLVWWLLSSELELLSVTGKGSFGCEGVADFFEGLKGCGCVFGWGGGSFLVLVWEVDGINCDCVDAGLGFWAEVGGSFVDFGWDIDGDGCDCGGGGLGLWAEVGGICDGVEDSLLLVDGGRGCF